MDQLCPAVSVTGQRTPGNAHHSGGVAEVIVLLMMSSQECLSSDCGSRLGIRWHCQSQFHSSN